MNRFRDVPPTRRTSTPDLIAELGKIQKLAGDAHRAVVDGRATTGLSSLKKIEHRAADAVRHAREDALA